MDMLELYFYLRLLLADEQTKPKERRAGVSGRSGDYSSHSYFYAKFSSNIWRVDAFRFFHAFDDSM